MRTNCGNPQHCRNNGRDNIWTSISCRVPIINGEYHVFPEAFNEKQQFNTIQKAIDQFGIDLIIMAAKNLNLFEQILFRPKMVSIKYYSKTPFLPGSVVADQE